VPQNCWCVSTVLHSVLIRKSIRYEFEYQVSDPLIYVNQYVRMYVCMYYVCMYCNDL